MYASHWDRTKPKGEMKVKVAARARPTEGRRPRAGRPRPASPGRLVVIATQ
jgi:hypothetical protein